MRKKKKKPKKVRNLTAIAAHFRHAGAMKDKRTERKGTKNKQREYLDEDAD